nr:HVA22-like protein i [Tanacetum cinerariifolium]
MSNMSEDIQYANSDTRPPMLDRTDYESWQQCIRLYCLGKDNEENIMKSIVEGPYQGTKTVTLAGGVEGLPKDIYALINHYTDAEDIWDNVKMLLEGSEVTKDDRESKLYDDFEDFRQNKGENIHSYYVSTRMSLAKATSGFRLLQGQDDAEAQENGVVLDEEQLLFLAGEHVTNFDDDGTKSICQSFVKPYLSKHEADIDRTLMELKTRAGDSATLYCSRVLVYGQTRAFEILQMVMAQAYQRPQAPPATAAPQESTQTKVARSLAVNTDNATRNRLRKTGATLYASSDTHPPMLDRTDYESWQHCIRLYCLGKDNGENVMKSIVEGHNQMGTKTVTLAGGVEGLPKDIYALINHYTDAKDIWDNVKMLLEGRQFQRNNARGFVGTGNAEGFRQLQGQDDAEAQENGAVLDEEQLLFLTGEHVTKFDDDVDDPPEQDLALNVDHVFEGTKSIYQSFVKPYLSKHEAKIDRTLMELKTRAGDLATLYCS